MATKTITVRENSRPTKTFVLTNADIGSEKDPSTVVDITNYAFRLVVKYDPFEADVFADANALVDLAGSIVVAADGSFKFDLVLQHTNLPPGTYFGEIRWWSDGTTTNTPHGAWSVDYVVEPAIDRTV